MSDASNNQSHRESSEQDTARRANLIYFITSGIGIVVLVALFFIFGTQDTRRQTPVVVKPQTVVSPVSKPVVLVPEPTAATKKAIPIEPKIVVAEPADVEPEIATIEPEAVTDEPATIKAQPQHVDTAIIPADHAGPPWALNLMSLSIPDNAPEPLGEIIALGYTPEVVEVIIDGRHWFRLRIKGFATISEARRVGQRFIGNPEYRTLWIGGY
ncbi:MAG: SPOR domain-containing protein [Mariprofundus sp.]